MTTHFLETISGTSNVVTTIGRTLADCQTVASLFDNTCDTSEGAIDLSSAAGVTMSCTGQMMCPNGDGSQTYTESSPCTFTRKLCVTCSEKSGVVYIRAQYNQMPNHCFQAINENPTPSDTDFEVIFNRDVTGLTNYSDTDFDSSAKTEEILCDL